jgi:excisionase family DNA binding protein
VDGIEQIMSSNIIITRVCVECGNHFTARTTVTKFCSSKCNGKNYKKRKRNEKVLTADKSLVDSVRADYKLLESKPFLKVTELSKILNVSRSTIYNLINNGTIPIIKIGNRTLISKKDSDRIFKSNQVIKTTLPKPIFTSYYTSSEAQYQFNISYSWLYQLLRKNNIPFTYYDSLLIISKPHLDNLMERRLLDRKNIKEWISVSDLMEEYRLSRDQVYNRTSKYGIPKKKKGRQVLISKKYFDEIMNPVI